MYKAVMSALKTLWNKITSGFKGNNDWKKDGDTMVREKPAPQPTTPYSETIDGVVFVTKENALRLIKDKKSTPPSEELKALTREAMLQQMVKGLVSYHQ